MPGAPIVVVGGGLAAGTAVVELREAGYDDEIVLFAEEPEVPYERPPLSKGFLQGEKERESTYVRPREWYDEHGVDLRLGEPVTSIDLDELTVRSDAGDTAFDRLLLATGARPRRLELAPTEEIEVRYLRTLADSTALRERLGAEHHLLIIGGGWIGMEVAATARTLGTRVTVVEPAEQPLLAALGAEVASRFADVHRSHGVDLRTGTGLDRLEGAVAVLNDGTRIEPDTVLVGVGAVPNVELAAAAGLGVDNGVLVDSALRTSHPAVYAAGDLANAAHPDWARGSASSTGRTRSARAGRLPTRCLANQSPTRRCRTSSATSTTSVWSSSATRWEPSTSRSSRARATTPSACWWFRNGGLVAAMHVNQWDRSDELRERVDQGA